MLSTLIKGAEIKMSPRPLGRILCIPSHGLILSEIKMDDDEVLSRIYLPGHGPPMANTKLQPIPRLIARILAYNICQKIDSYNYYSCDLAACAYAIMARLEVNWAKLTSDIIVKVHFTFLPYGAFLANMFQSSRF